MLNKKNILLTMVAAAAATLIVATQAAWTSPTGKSNKLEGAWISKAPSPSASAMATSTQRMALISGQTDPCSVRWHPDPKRRLLQEL